MFNSNAYRQWNRLTEWKVKPNFIHHRNDGYTEITIDDYIVFVPELYNVDIIIVRTVGDKQFYITRDINPSVIARNIAQYTAKRKSA